jgi:CxxC motif-containing protein (DUF1111 family)
MKLHSIYTPLLFLAGSLLGTEVTLELGQTVEWSTEAGKTYQLQRANVTNSQWLEVDAPMDGDPGSFSIFQSKDGVNWQYRLKATTPGVTPPPALPINGGFEAGSGNNLEDWITAGNGTSQRFSGDARTGTHSARALILNQGATPSEALLYQQVSAAGGTVTGGATYDFSFWAKQIDLGPSYIQQFEVQWLAASGQFLSGTGLLNFSAGTDTWTEIALNDLVAPSNAADAVIKFRMVTGAIDGGSGEVLIDDIALAEEGAAGEPSEEEITYENLTLQDASRLRWLSETSVPYQAYTSANLSDWAALGTAITGDGNYKEIIIPKTTNAGYFRIEYTDDEGNSVVLGPIVPLYSSSTELDAPITIETSEALITRLGDRARDRHARESQFHSYDHYLSWYWEERTIDLEIIDRVAKGGSTITFNYETKTALSQPEFRAFYRGIGTVAEYHFNYLSDLVGPNQYTATITEKLPEYRDLQLGDRVEIEISQFILAPQNGRNNYYGTTFLYIVGEGIVPWEGIGPLNDSYALPEAAWLGGTTTLPYQYSNEPEHRFKQTAGNISPDTIDDFMLGRRLHHTNFGDGSHSEPGNPTFAQHTNQLGPKFINTSCVSCHVNNGRALPPAIGQPLNRSVIKVASDALGTAHPSYGTILQLGNMAGSAEGNVSISSYSYTNGNYGDGSSYSLRKPNYAFTGNAPTYFSVRIAPQLVGLGLLEAVEETTILALSDPNDANNDGISGRMRQITDPETNEVRFGRFTYKGEQAKISHQIASALNTDMGVMTSIFPTPEGGSSSNPSSELSATELEQMTKYVAALGVGARRDHDQNEMLHGEALFRSISCTDCHTETLVTGSYHPLAELRDQTIHPYTDLLLHDMGPGLADNMAEAGVSASEWKTPPLWNIGLTAGVSGGEGYLHDGRARTLEEAILWHGGEAEAAKEAFRNLPAGDRADLIAFLKSL